MPRYEFVCREHDTNASVTCSIDQYSELMTQGGLRCLADLTPPHAMKRHYTPPAIKPSMPAHYNPSVGAWVTSMADFKSKLSAKSDEMSHRVGYTHNYTYSAACDREAFGITADRAAAATEDRDKRLRDAGVTDRHSPTTPADSSLVMDR